MSDFDPLALAAFRAYHGEAAKGYYKLSGWQAAVWREVAEAVIRKHRQKKTKRSAVLAQESGK